MTWYEKYESDKNVKPEEESKMVKATRGNNEILRPLTVKCMRLAFDLLWENVFTETRIVFFFTINTILFTNNI